MTNNKKAPIINNYQQQPSDREKNIKEVKIPINAQKTYSNSINSNKMEI